MRLRPGITRRCAPLAAGASWRPSDSANLTLWLESDSGLTVSQWTDQSANANHATQATGANQPTIIANAFGTLSGLRFVAAPTFMNLAKPLSGLISATAYTYLCVLKADSISALDCVVAEDGDYFAHKLNVTGPKSQASGFTTGYTTVEQSISTGAAFLHMQRHQGGNLYVSVNNAAETSVAAGNTGSLLGAVEIGARAASFGAHCTIGAILAWSVDLDTQHAGDLAKAVAYLRAKYGTP